MPCSLTKAIVVSLIFVWNIRSSIAVSKLHALIQIVVFIPIIGQFVRLWGPSRSLPVRLRVSMRSSLRANALIMYRKHLPHAVSAVNQQIITSHVGAGIADQVDIGTLQLLCLAIAIHGDHGEPQVLDLLVNEVGQTGVNVARRDAVDTGKVAPLVGERLGHMDAASLGDVVGGLLLGEVGDVARHGGCDNEATGATLLEVGADSLGTVEGTSQVGLNNLLPVLDGAVENSAVGSAAGVGDEGIDLAKLLNDVLDESLDALPLAHITLVGLDLDAVLLAQLLGVPLAALRSGSVGDGQVGAHLSAATSSLDAHSAGA